MANPKHLKVLLEGSSAWREWRKENPHVKPDLSGLTGSSGDVVFRQRGFLGRGELLKRPAIHSVDFQTPLRFFDDFSNADYHFSDLRCAYLRGCNLANSDLRGALLDGAVGDGLRIAAGDRVEHEAASRERNKAADIHHTLTQGEVRGHGLGLKHHDRR
jgi:hypothetical protein